MEVRKNASSAERIILIKDAQIEKKGNQNVPVVRGHMLYHTKGVWNTQKKNRHSGNMWSITKKHMLQLSTKTLSHSLKKMRHLLSRPNSSLKGMSGQSIISIISTDLGPFDANSVITFGMSFSIRWYISIFQILHRFPGN